MTTCTDCKRPIAVWPALGDTASCVQYPNGGRSENCRIAAAAYRRGIRDMLAVAKRTARLTSDYYPKINWTETEREAAKLAGNENGHG